MRVRGAYIYDELDLAHVAFPHPLHIISCVVRAPIDLRGAAIKDLGFEGSHIQELFLYEAVIAGNLYIGGGSQTGEVNAVGVRVSGQLLLNGVALSNTGGCALVLDTAEITGGVVSRTSMLTSLEKALSPPVL